MSTGCSIYFTPLNTSWIGTPEFIRGLASALRLEDFESVSVYRDAPTKSESRHLEMDTEKLVDMRAVSIDAALKLPRPAERATTVLSFGTTPVLEALSRDVAATLPETLSEGFVPIIADLYNGPWKHYDYHSGEERSDSSCCFIVSNNNTFPVELDAYLEAFLKVPSVVRLHNRIEELSGQKWRALIDLS